jgi:hypothetical protein
MSCRLLLCCAVFAGTVPCPAADPEDAGLREALATVVAAQPGGIGSARVAEAWKIVAQADYDQLPLILEAMDKADGLAANWISMALDRIVERQGVQEMPLDVLSAAALNSSHGLLTRKMALDLLSRADSKLVEDLQLDLMNDPESELRRPAIERAILQASELAAQDTPREEQIQRWLGILSAARDQDQVMQVARELKNLGREIDLAAQFGYLVDWYVIGPFDNTGGQGYDTAHAPEALNLDGFQEIVAGTAKSLPGKGGPVTWKRARAKAANGDVNLNEEIVKQRDVLGYGATVFVSDGRQQVDVRLRIQNSFKIWLNGKLLVEQPVGHTGNSFDQYKVRAELQPGKNLFVVKSCQVDLQGSTQFYDNWHFCVRVCDATGAAILSADRVVSSGQTAANGEEDQ